MTDILPPAGWPNVRQLETNEFASGGANGNMNEQAKSLAARTELLKNYTPLPYESGKSYKLNERVQIATGNIVRSTIASNVNNPNVNMTGWEVQDLIRSNNLSDVPDKDVARTNLGVYSTTQVNTAISNSATPAATELVEGKAKIATTAIAQAGVNDTDLLTAKKLRNALNAGGSAPVSAVRAWVCFNGKASPPVILSSLNISSVVKNATGDYTLNFTTPLENSNYAVSCGGATGGSGDKVYPCVKATVSEGVPVLKTPNQLRIACVVASSATTLYDMSEIYIEVFN